MSAAFQPQVLQDEMKPIKLANREAFIFPDYRRRMHEHAEETAIVTVKDRPIVRGGETLLLGMVPMDRRYAIGPVVDGRAEVYPQNEFEKLHEQVYIAEFGIRGQAPDDVKLRFVPNVVNFVAWKIDPSNPGRVTTLGYTPGQAAPEPKPDMLGEELARIQTEKDAQALQMDEMQRKLDELSALLATKPAPAPKAAAAPVAEQEEAPCGKRVTKGRVKPHMNFCKHESCLAAKAAAKE